MCLWGGRGGGVKQNEIKMKRIWDFGGRGPALHKKVYYILKTSALIHMNIKSVVIGETKNFFNLS